MKIFFYITPADAAAKEIWIGEVASENVVYFCKVRINVYCTFEKVYGILKVKFEMTNNTIQVSIVILLILLL